ncbi:phage tail protein [Actinophytocola xinjiangensis]|uniref:Phage tail protein n=1 Tax=Actinophytocola xinjiangensis TaxID=485602 RepID=A0A7Z1AYS7_9PSEU|nr:phage tail protein [Actinophytocola xinjiangensis]OLF10193.1 phage tail protein [Actinophytocola xinjiangensis]
MIDPLPKYRFIVTLDPGDAYLPAAQALLLPLVAAGAFQEVTGLGGQLEVVTYAEGGRNDTVHQLPLRHSWNRITLKVGVVRDRVLWSWYQAGLADSLGARRDGAVIVLGTDGVPAMAWAFHGGLAAKWSGPDLHAEQNAVAIEQLEIAHEGLTNVL